MTTDRNTEDQQLMLPNFDSDFQSDESSDSSTDDEIYSDNMHDDSCQRNRFLIYSPKVPTFLTIPPHHGDLITNTLPSHNSIRSFIQNGHGKVSSDEKNTYISDESLRVHDQTALAVVDFDVDHSAFEIRRNLIDAYRQKRKENRALEVDQDSHFDENMIFVSGDNDAHGNNDNNHINNMHHGNNNDDNVNRNHQNNDANHNPLNNDNNNNPGNNNPLPQGFFGLLGGLIGNPNEQNNMDEEDEERRNTERMEREAADVIANVIKRYRDHNIPENEFELIKLKRTERNTMNVTIRRMMIAVLAIFTGLIYIMRQTLPLLNSENRFTKKSWLDPLFSEILHIRDLRTHATNCGKELDRSQVMTIYRNKGGKNKVESFDCADKVLHIPSLSQIFSESSTSELDPIHFARKGINTHWDLPCNIPSKPALHVSNLAEYEMKATCFPLNRSPEETCSAKSSFTAKKNSSLCFRGVHDGIINSAEIESIVSMAGDLVTNGGTHMDVHQNVSYLFRYSPTTVSKLKSLMNEEYGLTSTIHPIAFRVSVTLPVDPDNWHFPKNSLNLTNAINKTALAELEAHILSRNYEVPFFNPFLSNPFRDPCLLMSDLEAADDFEILSSVFLSGENDFSGGASLFVDDHIDNTNPRKKIRRGVVIDGSKGRVLISTGGIENKRCRLPTRKGIRAVLQIWWSCR